MTADYATESAETLAEALHEARHARGGVPCVYEKPDDCVGYRASVKDAAAIIASDWIKRHDAEVRAEALREAADELDSVGHHWSGAPALAFFAIAGDLRDRTAALDGTTP